MAIDLGLAFGGDPDWLLDLPAEKRVRVLSWAYARKDRELAMWSAHGLQVGDLVQVLSLLFKGAKGTEKDLVSGMLAQLEGPPL